ncbi:unnamed protein product [Lupinus luteus]|uniref:RRM domain-containing protein n=1 Tax=Lupinus luteus TaxID=3873 RepID=A0AAV1XNC7_LUPLU
MREREEREGVSAGVENAGMGFGVPVKEVAGRKNNVEERLGVGDVDREEASWSLVERKGVKYDGRGGGFNTIPNGAARSKFKPFGFSKSLYSNGTSFFFTNFPVSFGTGDMWSVFSKFGKVGEVFIPPKKDKRGNRFGFVRFALKDDVLVADNVQSSLGDEHVVFMGDFLKETHVKNLLVGEVLNWEDTLSIKGEFLKRGIHSTVPIPLGRLHFLLKGDTEVNCSDLINMELDWCSALFRSISNWHPRLKTMEKIIWVRCWGVPVMAWTEEFFKFLAESVGVFVKVDDITLNMARVDFGRVLLSTNSMAPINKFLKVVCGSFEFDITLMEENPMFMQFNDDAKGDWKEEGSDLFDSDDGEWWPEEGDNEGYESFSVGDNDDISRVSMTKDDLGVCAAASTAPLVAEVSGGAHDISQSCTNLAVSNSKVGKDGLGDVILRSHSAKLCIFHSEERER